MKNFSIEVIKKNWEELFLEIKEGKTTEDIVLTIYVPFCGQKCSFSNCYVRKWDKHVIENYFFVIEKQIIFLKDIFKDYEFDTIIISGGSPSTLGEKNVSRLFKLLYGNFNIADEKYIIYETDIHFTNRNIMSILKENGVTNMTFGIQTIKENVLSNMNRFQDKEKIVEMVELMKEFELEINLDLVYGLPLDTLDGFKESLEFVYGLDVESINIYKYENSKGTEYYKSGIRETKDDYINRIKIMKNHIYDFFNNKPGILQETINGYGGSNLRLTTYFRDEGDIDYNDWRQTCSVLNLGYGEKSFIFGKMEYELFLENKLYNNDLITKDEVDNGFTGNIFTFHHSLIRYFLIRFSSFLDLDLFREMFKVDALNILDNEIKLLYRLGKLNFDKENNNIIF